MIEFPYAGIDERIVEVLESLIPSDDDYHMVHARRHARTLQVLGNNKLGVKVLELGTSDVIPLALRELDPGLEVTVTSFTEGAETGKLKLSKNGKEMVVPSYRIDLESEPIPCDDQTFDVVICSEVIEHMDVDPMFMMAEINRVLKMNGLLVLTTPNCNSTHAIWKMLRGIEPYFFMQYHTNRDRYRHNYEYSIGVLSDVIFASGFMGNVWSENSFEEPVTEDMERLDAAGYEIDWSRTGDNLFVVAHKVDKVLDRYPASLYVQSPAVRDE